MVRRNSLNRSGLSDSIMMTSTLHLSPMRARTRDTFWQSPICGLCGVVAFNWLSRSSGYLHVTWYQYSAILTYSVNKIAWSY